MKYEIRYPEDYLEFEAEAKGYLYGTILLVDDKRYTLSFYNIVRLKQDVEDSLIHDNYFFEHNLIIIHTVKKESIDKAIKKLIENNELVSLKED